MDKRSVIETEDINLIVQSVVRETKKNPSPKKEPPDEVPPRKKPPKEPPTKKDPPKKPPKKILV